MERYELTTIEKEKIYIDSYYTSGRSKLVAALAAIVIILSLCYGFGYIVLSSIKLFIK